MNQTPLVSIVMLCWNRKDDVAESLRHIRRIDYPRVETIVVDNHSGDGTPELIREQFPEVRLLVMTDNLGIEGYNHGFEAARGEFIVIIDDDSFPAPDALTAMVRRFQEEPTLGVVAFNVHNVTSLSGIHHEPVQGEHMVPSQYDMPFNGAGVGLRRDLFKSVGWYPAEFFLYQNEPDVSLRILDRGFRIGWFPEIRGYHKFSPVNRHSRRAPYYYTRNLFWLVWKNYPFSYALGRTLLLVFDCFRFSFEQRTTVYLQALWHAFVQVGAIRGKRKPLNKEIVKRFRIPYRYAFTFYR